MNRFHRWYCRSGHWRNKLEGRLLPWVLDGVDLGDSVLEIGPGPGVSTDWLRVRVDSLTAVEIDEALAVSLAARTAGGNVRVLHGSGTALPFGDGELSAVVCFTMLHHVSTPVEQDAIFAEAHRVLRPGGWFCGSDSMSSTIFRLAHRADTMVLVPPETLAGRLRAAGFESPSVDAVPRAFRFRAQRRATRDMAD